MEKGNSKSSSAKSTDSKVKQDVTNKFLRFPRNKDSISPRPETRRKPNPQRSREVFDKRPRNRTGAVCEKYRSEIAEDSVNDPYNKLGCKKVNLNHLLNFTLAPIESRDIGGRRSVYNRNRLPKYNKELFLQANCQFVVKEDGNYSIHLGNPDILVEWSLIEEILLPSYEVPLCPICLYTPVAAKITKCGHVYCWSCMLHYLALTDRTWQKCPICFDAVHKTELKSVSIKLNTSFAIGKEISMRLMKRERKSLLPVPASSDYPVHLLCNRDNDDTVTRFQKLLLVNKSQMLGIIKREHSELMDAYMKERYTPEVCFIEEALKLLAEREETLKNDYKLIDDRNKPVVNKEFEKQTAEAHATDFSKKLWSGRKHTVSQSSVDTQGSSQDETFDADNFFATSPDENYAMSQVHTIQETEKKNICYFYQAEDGQHIFLHNINVRMIIKEYGSLEQAPELIRANIVDTERVSMTDVLRKRLRYLKHLPLTCEFLIVELNFSQVLSRSTTQQFEGEVIKRKQFRTRKARDERRREKYIEREENKKLGKYPRATYNLKSCDQFPAYDPLNDFQPLPLSNSASAGARDIFGKVEDIGNNINTLSLAERSEETEATPPTTSFAQMLKDGQAKGYQPTFSKQKQAELAHKKEEECLDSDGERYVPPLDYHTFTFSDAIQIALDSAMSQNNNPSAESQKSSKKKKLKKKLLFTTTMSRTK